MGQRWIKKWINCLSDVALDHQQQYHAQNPLDVDQFLNLSEGAARRGTCRCCRRGQQWGIEWESKIVIEYELAGANGRERFGAGGT